MRKTDIWAGLFVFVSLCIGIALFVIIFRAVGIQAPSVQSECVSICESNVMNFSKVKTKVYGNDVCYCLQDGSIQTFVMGG